MVRRRGFSREEESMRRHLHIGVVPQTVVENDDVKHIEQLPLVLMDAFNLTVEDRVRIHDLSRRCLEPVCECGLGFALRLAEIVAEARVAAEWHQLAKRG